MMMRFALAFVLAVTSAESIAKPKVSQQWKYGTQKDSFEKTEVKYAELVSENYADIGFPYGKVRLTVELRSDSKEGDYALFYLSKGIIDCETEYRCLAKLKVNDDDAFEITSSRGQFGRSSGFVHDADYYPFAKAMTKAGVLIVRVPVYGFGNVDFRFKNPGVKWPVPELSPIVYPE